MCFRVECKVCGKSSWSGCGKHVASVYAQIEKGKHCMCRSWPGVVMPSETGSEPQPQQQQQQQQSSGTSSCSTL